MERQYLRKKYVKTNKEKNASNILDACVCQGEAACQGVGRARGEGVARGGASSGPSVGAVNLASKSGSRFPPEILRDSWWDEQDPAGFRGVLRNSAGFRGIPT